MPASLSLSFVSLFTVSLSQAQDQAPAPEAKQTETAASLAATEAAGPAANVEARDDSVPRVDLFNAEPDMSDVALAGEADVFGGPGVGASEATDGAAPGEDEADGELDLSDVFGDDEVIDLPSQDESEGGQNRAPSKWDDFDASVRIVSSIYMDVDRYINKKRWTWTPEAYGGFSRHETRLEFLFSYTPNEHIQIVGDIEPVFLYFPEQRDLVGLTDRRQMYRYHVESDAAYVAINDLLPGLDLKLGRQIVVWGTADKFNPTNNINADDLEDRPLFTEPIANQMAVVDYTLPNSDKFWAQAVYVPFFTPALLPPSAATALLDPNTMPPYVNESEQDAIRYLQGFLETDPRYVPDIYADVVLPENRFKNGQAALKVGSKLGPVDLSASYYRGFHDIPMPVKVESTQLAPLSDEMAEVAPEERFWYRSDVTLIYPKMQVVGLDFATQLGFLDNAGLWGEAGLFFPGDNYEFDTELPIPLDVTPSDGTPNPITEVSGPVVGAKNGKATPYVKATVGMDYTIGKHVYLQGQYLRGFIDEFGAGNMGNYLVAGSELVFFGRHLVVRTFAVVDFPDDKDDTASTVLAPSLIMVPPWGFVTIEAGGFAFIGKYDTKFGQSATGSSIAFLKVAGQF